MATHLTTEPAGHARTDARLAATSLVVAATAAIVLDTVAPGAGPLVQPLSSFAHTEYAWLWRVTVGAGSAALLLLAWALRGRQTSRALQFSLAAAGVGLAVVGACDADLWFPWERTPTLSGGIHVEAVLLVLVALLIAMVARSRSVPPRPGTRWSRAWEFAYLGSLMGALAYVGAVTASGRPPHLFGLWERLALGSALAWSGLLAVGALRRGRAHGSR